MLKIKVKRKRRSDRTPHTKRPKAKGLVHVTLKLCGGLPEMRSPRTYRILERAFREAKAKDRNGMRLIEFSIMGNHIHLIVEVEDERALSRGMQGLAIRLAKALNKRWGRKGKVWRDRFHSVLMETYFQVRKAFRYVLLNAKKHGYVPKSARFPDPYSSGRWFQWCDWEKDYVKPLREAPVVAPRCLAWIPSVSLAEWPGMSREIETPEFA